MLWNFHIKQHNARFGNTSKYMQQLDVSKKKSTKQTTNRKSLWHVKHVLRNRFQRAVR